MDTSDDPWNIVQTLGEGAYGEVKLLIHRETGDAVAMKIVDLEKHEDASACVRKEVCIHQMLFHPNIVRFLGRRQEVNKEYLFLEYAAGGELFDRIEPDVGMGPRDACQYMTQLLSGVRYLHQKGIAHRDLKPENLLLDESGVLKISDFGLATLFRHRGRERRLDKRCGSLPYVAPEVLQTRYEGQPADIWSCGIILVAMLTGELPWDQPTEQSDEYIQWITDNYLLSTPWSKIENSALSLLRKTLSPAPEDRPTIQHILQHPWIRIYAVGGTDGEERNPKRSSSITDVRNEVPSVTLSQPVPSTTLPTIDLLSTLLKTRDSIYFSQPTQNENLIINSQIQFTQSPITQNNLHRLVKRMTRFFVKTSCEETLDKLRQVLDKLHYNWNTDACGTVSISTVDNKKMHLVFKANIIDMDGKLLLDFRLSKGCGLEFKRRFIKIKNSLRQVILYD